MKDLNLSDDPQGRGAFVHVRSINDKDVHLRLGHNGKWIGVLLDQEEAVQLRDWLSDWILR